MIRVGIIGAETKNAGELLRLLMFHPEVEISSLYSPTLTGHKLSACHHGFIGEPDYYFSDKIDLSRLNAVFLTDDSSLTHLVLERASEWNELRIIDLSPSRFGKNMMEENLAYGLSEINRKTLVRGATMAKVPSVVGAVSLIALYPLASHLLLSSDIEIESWLPLDIIREVDP
ncbi:MAG: hypothetical protein K2M10_00575 [Muribaculaceae bacterium]|nr:hypothetical protein [Muribaculaceae bacterium]